MNVYLQNNDKTIQYHLDLNEVTVIAVHMVYFVGFIFSLWDMKQSCTLTMIKMLHVMITEMKSKGLY